MRILDRERYFAYFKAYLVCFITLVGLYVVIDAFANIDEFSEIADTTTELFFNMGRFYLIKSSLFFDKLCGVITMMGAIFTVTWLQKNNELLAMNAAGISTSRVIRPVLIAAVLTAGLAVANQEWIMPAFAEELQRPADDDGKQKIKIHECYDSRGILISSSDSKKLADRETRTVFKFNATVPVSLTGEIIDINAVQGRYIPPGATGRPHAGGWLLYGARLVTKTSSEALDEVLIKLDNLDGFPKPAGITKELPGNLYFLKSDLSFTELTRNSQWYQFASTRELLEASRDQTYESQRSEISVFLHSRVIRPLTSVALLLVGLPLVLGGPGRNMYLNLGLSMGVSAVFYVATFICQYLGSNEVFTPELAAWIPLIAFGTIAVARWDTIRS